MLYEDLRKVYYKNREGHEQEYRNRFRCVAAVPMHFTIGENRAFFVSTEEIAALTYQIMMIDKQINQTRNILPQAAIKQYFRKSLIDEIHQSLDIEQVYSTKKEIADLYRTNKPDRLQGMVRRYEALFARETIPLRSCEDVRALYDEICLPEVVQEDPGNKPDGEIFRKLPVHVISRTNQEIHTGLFPESRIMEAMKNALDILEDETIELLKRVAVFHYMLGYIHPFYDGNGRLARFISSYMLSRAFDPLIGVRLSFTINRYKSQYYDMFKLTNDPKNKGDMTPFIIGFLQILKESFAKLAEALQSRKDRLLAYNAILDKIIKEPKKQKIAFLLLQVALFGTEGLTLKDTAQISGVGYKTVDKCLKSPLGTAMFRMKKDGKRKLYQMNLDWLDQRGI